MSEETAISALEAAALDFAREFNRPAGSLQEHQERCAIASAMLITAALELAENGTSD